MNKIFSLPRQFVKSDQIYALHVQYLCAIEAS